VFEPRRRKGRKENFFCSRRKILCAIFAFFAFFAVQILCFDVPKIRHLASGIWYLVSGIMIWQ